MPCGPAWWSSTRSPRVQYAIGDALERAQVEVDLRRVYSGRALPASLHSHAGLVLMGGPMSATDDQGFPSRREEIALLRQAVERGLPVLGVCLGAQLLALAAGGSVFKDARGPEIGWGEVELTAEASDDALFSALPEKLDVLHWHGDTFTLPDGAIHLAHGGSYEKPGLPSRGGRLGAPVPRRGRHVSGEGLPGFLRRRGSGDGYDSRSNRRGYTCRAGAPRAIPPAHSRSLRLARCSGHRLVVRRDPILTPGGRPFEHLDAVPTCRLGLEKSAVGLLEQFARPTAWDSGVQHETPPLTVTRGGVVGRRRGEWPCRHRSRIRSAAVTRPPRCCSRAGAAGTPRHRSGRRSRLPVPTVIEALCDLAQGLVAGEVAVVVVVELEVVDVEQRHAVGPAGAKRAGVGRARRSSSMRRRLPRPVSASVSDCSSSSRLACSSWAAEVGDLAVQVGHPLGGDQAGLHGEGVDRLDQVVVGAGAHAFEDLLGVVEAGDQHDVDVVAARVRRARVGTARARRGPASSSR